MSFREKSIYLHSESTNGDNMKPINRIKVMLVEKQKTGKWLAEQLGRDPATVSRWCSNTMQPSIETFAKIAELLNVDVKDLFNSSK
jgi:transcriptional regulator with XRE-family HTH domain